TATSTSGFYTVSLHDALPIWLGVGSGILGLGTIGFLATSELDIHFEGIPSHAGANPELGKNALLAAANCAINLHTLPQFSTGMRDRKSTRLNSSHVSISYAVF